LAELAEKVSGDEEIEELIRKLNKRIQTDGFDSGWLHLRAELYVKLQQHHKAINDYNLILSKNKSDQKALVQLEMLTTILRYNNTDIYSSTNTNMDPWME
jgi:regulator of sirC expression with transglutaminase-like and TPR domain